MLCHIVRWSRQDTPISLGAAKNLGLETWIRTGGFEPLTLRSKKSQVVWLFLSALVPSKFMQKGSFRDNIEKLVRLLPRPKMNGKLIARLRNSWLIVEEYGQADGIVVSNKITNHEGQIPYDSIREWREPDIVILWSQVNVGKNGLFELSPFLDGPETEMLVEGEEFLPERVRFVKDRLKNLTDSEIKLLTRLVIQVRMRPNEIWEACSSIGISDDPRIFFNRLIHKTGMIEKDSPHSTTFTAWIMDTFAPILERELFLSPANNEKVVHPPSPPSTPESETS